LGRWCDGRRRKAGERKWRNVARNRAEACEGGLGSKGAVVPMVTMMTPRSILSVVFNFANIVDK